MCNKIIWEKKELIKKIYGDNYINEIIEKRMIKIPIKFRIGPAIRFVDGVIYHKKKVFVRNHQGMNDKGIDRLLILHNNLVLHKAVREYINGR